MFENKKIIPTYFTLKMERVNFNLMTKKAFVCICISVSLCFNVSSCSIRNTFNPPKSVTKTEELKRLIIFTGSNVNRRDPSTNDGAGYTLLGIPDNKSRKINLSQPRRRYATYVLEMAKNDTGSIKILMGLERPLFGNKLFAEGTILTDELSAGNHYLYLNYYIQAKSNFGMVPIISIKNVDIERDFFIAPTKTRFKHVLTYNLSADSVIYEKKKAIVSNQKGINNIYKNIKKSGTSVDSLLAARKK